MKLYLIRHGRTVNNVSQACQGWIDTDLDEVGQDQANAVADFFKSLTLSHIFSSDLRRCLDTASPTARAKNIKIESSPLLRERSLGELENAPITELRAAFEAEIARTGESRFKVRPMGVESAEDVMARVSRFASSMPLDQGNVAVFTHGMTEECILCHLIGAPVESSRSFSFDNASITTLEWAWNVWVVEKYNATDHLQVIKN